MLEDFRIALLILCVVPSLLAHEQGHAFLDHLNVHGNHHHHARSRRDISECGGSGGECVPRIQCPAALRAYHVPCHVAGHIGVCCTTGHSHAGENDRKHRSDSSPSAEDLRSAHHSSERRLEQWLQNEKRIETNAKNGTVLSRNTPSYGHFMSIRTGNAEKEQTLGRGALRNLFATQTLKQRKLLSEDQLRLGVLPITDKPTDCHWYQAMLSRDRTSATLLHVTARLGTSDSLFWFYPSHNTQPWNYSMYPTVDEKERPFCPSQPSCPTPQRYSHISGECNNAANTGWGSSHTAYERILPPNYGDETWSLRVSVSGEALPSARAVSDALLLDIDNPSTTRNLMLTQFGQFIIHDITAGATFRLANGSAISCCTPDGSFLPPELQHEGCAAIDVQQSDQFFSQFQLTCMNFVRTQLAPSHDCSLGHAKQMNGVTHFPDLSTIYGSSESQLAELRDDNGRMRTFVDFGRELPPLTVKTDDCLLQQDGAACFASGDGHVNQMISLVSLHTIWIREHNRLVEALARLNPAWPPDVLFLEARRILVAEYRHLIYNEWLPLVVGRDTMEAFKLTPLLGGQYSSDYRADINPSITNEAAAAALRFGHSTVDSKLKIPQPDKMYEEIFIPEVMFQPSRIRLRQFHDRLLTGLSWQPMQTVDPFITEALTRYMFHGGQPFGLDLAAINIQRGRDHGLRSYNDYLRLIGSKPLTDFSQFSPKAAERLSSVYASPDDIDLWIGGLMEPPLEDAVVGTTFAHIIADQFSRLRRGDRYFYEHGPDVNPGAFTKDQLAEIKKVTLARIVCDNSDGIELMSYAPHGFLRPHVSGNDPVPCDSRLIPSMDLSKFKEI